ncbi:uncharacterized protein LOC135679736 [Musa acuminata AAA Group]|uniref:uncharacterized protein LOC135679736 n=1 Tax=Musa acuminata AAA Group TaxID=214697 RepID=UPI0031D73E9D
MAYKSHKLNETERWYPVHEKEMTAVVHYLRVWRHYLLGSQFVLRTKNIALSYFQTQKKLSPKQARWQDFLAEFNIELEYKPGKENVVTDALSQKVECVNVVQLEGRGQANQLHYNFLSKIRDGLYSDPQAVTLMQLIKEGKGSSASNMSPFEIITGQQPSTPHTLAIRYTRSSLPAYHFAKEWHRNIDIVPAYLEKVAKKMKKWADLGRRFEPLGTMRSSCSAELPFLADPA